MLAKITLIIALMSSLFCLQLQAQDRDFSAFSEEETIGLKQLLNRVETEEKSFLKTKVKDLNTRLEEGNLSPDEAQDLKILAAEQTAKTIADAQNLVFDWASFQKEKYGEVEIDQFGDYDSYLLVINEMGLNPSKFNFDFNFFKNSPKEKNKRKPLNERDLPYSPRTLSELFISISFNNAVLDGGSIDNTSFKFGGSRSFEIGYEWSTRLFKESNFLRINYGVSFQFNGLKPKNNTIFVANGEQTVLEPFEFDLEKAKFRMDNLILPVHLQFGNSKTTVLDNGNKRFTDQDFKVGLGGFVGINLLNTQKLKFDDGRRDEKLKQRDDFNTNNLLYGLSAFVGWETVAIFAQYNLNPIFTNNVTDLNNFQIGVRLLMDRRHQN
ncbi:TonB-dependent receptor [Psychroflexus torquis]|nr:TonB-dependent receptor [Psychroflexus torquis]